MSFFQEPPQLRNQFDDDRHLQSYLKRVLPVETLEAIEPSLREMGELAAGELSSLSREHRLDEPRHTPFDPWGHRIDEVSLSPSWQAFARIAAEKGLLATAYERRHGPYSRLHHFALVYLFHPSTQMYMCPLAMSDGCARTLELLGPPELRSEVLPHLLSRDPTTAWTAGQWMTERTGGSDVGLSETEARKEGESWRLYGTKWFTSAVTSQVALTLARPEGNGPGGKGLALFLVKVRDEQGRLNGIEVMRLKDKLGTRHVPTAELKLNGTEATPIAGLTEGVRNIAAVLNLTRTWNAVAAVAGMRRGLALARDYAHRRAAFGAHLIEKPLHQSCLADLETFFQAAHVLTFHQVQLLGREETEGLGDRDSALLRVLQAVTKLLTGKWAVWHASEVLEAFGGAGYVEDTGLPELLRDAQVLPIWEGTTNVLALETCRAITRTQAMPILVEEVQSRAAGIGDPALTKAAQVAVRAMEHAAHWWGEVQSERDRMEAGARTFVFTLGKALALALLVEHAQWSLECENNPKSRFASQRFAASGIDLLCAPESELEALRALAGD